MRYQAFSFDAGSRFCDNRALVGLVEAGRVPEWTKGADCKSVVLAHRGFESHRGLFLLQRKDSYFAMV